MIQALGRNDELARGAIRFSFGKDNTEEDVDHVLEILPRVVEKLDHRQDEVVRNRREDFIAELDGLQVGVTLK